MTERLRDKTIDDFGDQWSRYVDNSGHYGSVELFYDIVGPQETDQLFRGATVVDIGSGTGRIVDMLFAAGAGRVVAVEPSRAFDVLVRNTRRHGDRIICLNLRGDMVPTDLEADAATSIGVLHHIPDPEPVMRAVHAALKPGGTFIAWLYGREGNELYLRLVEPLRVVTKALPHWVLTALCHVLTFCLALYVWLAGIAPVPMGRYMTEVIRPLDYAKRYLVIYDQLNPQYAKYYTQVEARRLFETAGFVDIHLHHRHGYSWTVTARKPDGATGAPGTGVPL